MTVATRLGQLARSPSPAPPDEVGRCELCAQPIAPDHRHVVDVRGRSLLCACRACVVLLGRPGAGGGHYRLVPERRLRLPGFRLDDATWATLGIPVDLAFFFHSSAAGRVVAVYPGPIGATESQLPLGAWQQIEVDNPQLESLEEDVEALLVRRADASSQYYLVPIDDCYALAGVLRTHWRGLTGGRDVWREIDAYFDRLRRRAKTKEE